MQPELYQLNAALELSHWWFVGRRMIISGLVHEVLPKSLESQVVDIGCGTGANVARLAGDYDVVGFDLSEQAVALASARFPEVTFHCRNAVDDIRGMSGGQRVFLLNDVLEHIDDDKAFLEEVVTAAPIGSRLLMTVPADPSLWSPHDVSHGHFRRYSFESFRSLWSTLPVREQLYSCYNARLRPFVQVVRKITGSTNRSFGASDSDLSVPPWPLNRLLTQIFAGELAKLRAAIGSGRPAYRRGVSLIAILQKTGATDATPI